MYNIFEKQKDINVRNAQIVYMAKELEMTPSQIKKYVDLALSTIRNYIYKFEDMLDQAREWFGDKAKQLMNNLRKKCEDKNIITYECEKTKNPCSYIIEYFDSQRNFLFLKVGMTERPLNERIREHLRDYVNLDATYAVVKEIHPATDKENAEIMESLYRQHYKKLENNGFIKQDRFSMVRYDKQELEQDTILMSKVKLFEMAAA